MKRPVIRYIENEDGEMIGYSYPDYEEWSTRQKQVAFALSIFCKSLPPTCVSYVAYQYGECIEVIGFAKFYEDFWYSVGQYFENIDWFDLIDEKFIAWVSIMQFEEHCEDMSMDFDKAFKKFMFI